MPTVRCIRDSHDSARFTHVACQNTKTHIHTFSIHSRISSICDRYGWVSLSRYPKTFTMVVKSDDITYRITRWIYARICDSPHTRTHIITFNIVERGHHTPRSTTPSVTHQARSHRATRSNQFQLTIRCAANRAHHAANLSLDSISLLSVLYT